MSGSSIPPRRNYDNTSRRQKADQTRDKIVAAGSELVHEFESWNWQGLTFKAVAERAAVGERTVYRHFPSEQLLHDAVMQRLEDEAGISYEDIDLTTLDEVTTRIFASLQRFSVRRSAQATDDPTFNTVDERRRAALQSAVATAAAQWSDTEQRAAAALLDLLWNVEAYERMVGVWGLEGSTASQAMRWLIAKMVRAIDGGQSPLA
ncbi:MULTISPECIES: TetR/AcrR family transcriptional regulator [Mycobacteriaceae]|uniref:TetR/AcrR family transcriptional regulator n=1 Tax=Mycolicibacterium parafortuitum TaxID=39692 RepID=A0ACC6MLG4_MYCPF|nr:MULTISPECIES: TetR/AcrR family transcriptional regulator [Mycobacteriaceae]MDZ5087775.1 TetR/AcrR family transcriptional regulator [Mycolicibacterium parafortuitum]GFM19890.1 transcriptional regulator [Mycobacterium sp. PO1]GFM26442.1 transcriptional regulator [Mycobacterium sp. PO2]